MVATMGYDIDRFVNGDDIPGEYICGICNDVLEDAQILPHCEHMYCHSCISDWFCTGNTTCPQCRRNVPAGLFDLRQAPRPILSIIGKLNMKCEFTVAGCPHIGPLEMMLDAHSRMCIFNPNTCIECPYGCGLEVSKLLLDQHNCVQSLKELLMATAEARDNAQLTLQLMMETIDNVKEENNRLRAIVDIADNVLVIDVSNPITHQDGNRRYTDYEIRMRTTLPIFTNADSVTLLELSVRRRYSDFDWLRKKFLAWGKLREFPPFPDKAWKRQLPFRGDDGIFEEDFLEERRKGLELFLQKVARDSMVQGEWFFHKFLLERTLDKTYVPPTYHANVPTV